MLARLRVPRFLATKHRLFVSSKSYSHQDYCRDLVKKADYYNFLCCLPLPQPQQRLAFAVRAYNVEVSLIRDRAPTPETANLRFQYWEDSIRALFGGNGTSTRLSPILSELGWAVDRFAFRLSQLWLLRLLQARRDRPGSVAFRDCTDLEDYSESTNAPIYYCLAEAFGLKSLAVDHALSHLAKAQGLVNHLRSVVPLARQQRVLLLPTDLLAKHELPAEIALRLCRDSAENSRDPASRERLRDVCQELATRAREHAAKAVVLPSPDKSLHRPELSVLPLLLLPSVPLSRLLRLFLACNFDPCHPRWLQPREGMMPLRVAWHAVRRTPAMPP